MPKVNRRTEEETIAIRLAHIFQQWSETCKRGMELEMSEELQYYMAGRADAHAMDATRARTATSILTSERLPAELTQFSQAYEIMVQMLAAFAGGEVPPRLRHIELEDDLQDPPQLVEPPIAIEGSSLFHHSETALQTLRERAARLQSDDPDST